MDANWHLTNGTWRRVGRSIRFQESNAIELDCGLERFSDEVDPHSFDAASPSVNNRQDNREQQARAEQAGPGLHFVLSKYKT